MAGAAGPPVPRWTHVALPTGDLDAAIRWYRDFTPLVVIDEREDADGRAAWLSNDHQVADPFILVLVMFWRDEGRRQGQLGPFAHLGIELPSRAAVDDVAARARAAGCLAWEPIEVPPPVGYVCAASDPDGNVVEFSHDQGVYAKVREVWGDGDA